MPRRSGRRARAEVRGARPSRQRQRNCSDCRLGGRRECVSPTAVWMFFLCVVVVCPTEDRSRPIKTSDAQAQGSSGPSARQVCDRQPQQQKLTKRYKHALEGPRKTGPPGCRGEHSTDRPSHSENRTHHHQGSGPSTHSTPPCGSHLNSEQDTGRYGQGQPRLPFGRYVPPHQRGHPVDAPRNGPGDRGCTRRHSGSGGRTGNHISLDLTCPPQPQQWGQDSGWGWHYGEGSDEQRGHRGNWSPLPPAWPSSGSRYPPSGASPGLQQWYGWMRMGPSGDGGLGPQFLPGQGSGSNCLGAWGSGPAGNWHVCLGTQPGSPGEMEGQRFLPPCAGPVSGAEDVGDSRHERLEQEGEDNFKCVVCQDETRDIVLEPCRHFCACKACAEAFVSCPMCRSTIESKTQVFVS